MRMKKLLILSAAVLGAVACSNTYEVKTAPEKAIGFGTWTETLTKAREQGSNDFTNGDDFAVYGFKVNSSTNTIVFDDVTVSTTDGNSWKYSPVRYWDPSATSYTFYAVSPASVGTAGTVNPETGEMTSASITFAGNDNDILVADKTTVNKTDGSGNFNNYGKVKMVFNHVVSLVDVKVKKAPTLHDATVTVTALSLDNIENNGVMTVSADYNKSTTATPAGANGPVATWSTDTKASYGPANGVEPITVSESSPITIAEDTTFPGSGESYTPGASTPLINSLVVKPQTFSTAKDPAASQKLTITYKISVTGGGENTYTGSVWLADFDKIDDTDQEDTKVAAWEAGKHYVFYLTLGANSINFTASINPWAEVINGYNYLLN